MPKLSKIHEHQLSGTSGQTVTINCSNVSTADVITGTVNFGSNNLVVTASNLFAGAEVNIVYKAALTTSGAFTIMGKTVPIELHSVNFIATCVYYGSWFVNITPDFGTASIVDSNRIKSNAVTTAKITDKNVTLDKIEDVTRGTVIVGGASDRPIERNGNSGDILQHDGTDVVFNQMSGDATIDDGGVITIEDDAINADKISDFYNSRFISIFYAALDVQSSTSVDAFVYSFPTDIKIKNVRGIVSKTFAGDKIDIYCYLNGSLSGAASVPDTTAAGTAFSVTVPTNTVLPAGQTMSFRNLVGGSLTAGSVCLFITFELV